MPKVHCRFAYAILFCVLILCDNKMHMKETRNKNLFNNLTQFCFLCISLNLFILNEILEITGVLFLCSVRS